MACLRADVPEHDPDPTPGLRSSPRISASATSICSVLAWSMLPIRRTNREQLTARIALQTARLG
ncbi:MAG: hypothetical protein L0H79_06435 [Intrasporangium sp.]|nr:hypothetical protein [Intrasporangium sp.]MDN5795375.1 hypothetical protein [Intrasporangium sp.]